MRCFELAGAIHELGRVVGFARETPSSKSGGKDVMECKVFIKCRSFRSFKFVGLGIQNVALVSVRAQKL